MQDVYSSKKLLFFLCRKSCLWPFGSKQDFLYAHTAREPLAGLWLAIMPQNVLLFFFPLQAHRHTGHLPPTGLTVRFQSHQIKLKKNICCIVWPWLQEVQQLFKVSKSSRSLLLLNKTSDNKSLPVVRVFGSLCSWLKHHVWDLKKEEQGQKVALLSSWRLNKFFFYWRVSKTSNIITKHRFA